MKAAPLASPTVDPLWSALAVVGTHPVPAWRWRQLLSAEPESCRFLNRVALLADRVPCPHACGCGQLHRVEQIEPGDFCAIPQDDDCESASVTHEELSVYALDSARLAKAVAHVFSIRPEISVAGDAFGMLRLGVRSQEQAPVFMSFPSTPADTIALAHSLAAATRASFTLLVPTPRMLTHDVCSTLVSHGAVGATLADHVALRTPGELLLHVPLPRLPSSIAYAPSVPTGGASSVRGNVWPHARPEDPTWSDVSLTLHLQEVFVRFGNSQASFDHRDIDGFTDRRGTKRPNRVWTMLRAFAARHGVLPLPSKSNDPVNVRTLADLDRVLGRFFCLTQPSLDRDFSERTVRTRFRVTSKG